MRILRGAQATAQVAYYTGEELADPGVVTVTVTRPDGTAVATGAATTGTGAAPRTYTLTGANTATLGRLTLTWTSATLGIRTTVEDVVGGHLFELAELRSRYASQLDAARHPTTALASARDAFTVELEEFCARSFVPVAASAVVRNPSTFTFLPHHPVRTITLVRLDGIVDTSWWAWRGTETSQFTLYTAVDLLEVFYEHGLDAPPPDVVDAAMTAVYDRLVSRTSGRPSRAYQQAFAGPDGGVGTTRFSTPSESRLTGIPEVDAVFARWRSPAALVQVA